MEVLTPLNRVPMVLREVSFRDRLSRKNADPHHCAHWGWYHMPDLKKACEEALGWTGCHAGVEMNWPTFNTQIMLGRELKPFVWIIYSDNGPLSRPESKMALDMTMCQFHNAHLYVPVGWGNMVRRCALQGIQMIEQDKGRIIGRRWSAGYVAHDVIKQLANG